MARFTSIYVCQNCGAKSAKWQGKCTECQAWNSLVEEVVQTGKSTATKSSALKSQRRAVGAESFGATKPLLEQAKESQASGLRISSGFKELDRVLGEQGFVEGSLLLFGGEPGIGKSTLLLQILGKVSGAGQLCLYVSAEESAHQVASRAERLGIKPTDNFHFLATTELEVAQAAVENLKPQFIVIDSVQTISAEVIESASGTVSQVRAVTQAFLDIAKRDNRTVLLVGHVTKEGNVAGPRLLEHMVDGVFYFEMASSSGYRLIRGQKNRFGSTQEVAVFEMSGQGLVQVDNPSARFLAERSMDMSGSAVVAQLEGSRPFLTEFQAITQRCFQGYPRRTVQGVDQNRISVLLAVSEKALGLSFSEQDVYCKVASGDRIEEPASDLALLMCLVSALIDRPIPADLLFIGEVGLGGEIRSVPALSARLSEARSVGMKRAVVPKWNAQEAKGSPGVALLPARTVKEAFELVFGSYQKKPKAAPKKAHQDEELGF